MACGPKEYRAHAELCLRRARTVRNPLLAKEFEKLAQSWLRLATATERSVWSFNCGLRSIRKSVPKSSS